MTDTTLRISPFQQANYNFNPNLGKISNKAWQDAAINFIVQTWASLGPDNPEGRLNFLRGLGYDGPPLNPRDGGIDPNTGQYLSSAQTMYAASVWVSKYKPGGGLDPILPYVAPAPDEYIEDPTERAIRIAQENSDRAYLAQEQQDKRHDDTTRRAQDITKAIQAEQNASSERVAQVHAGASLAAAQISAASGVQQAQIGAQASLGVANIHGQASRDVANIGASAQLGAAAMSQMASIYGTQAAFASATYGTLGQIYSAQSDYAAKIYGAQASIYNTQESNRIAAVQAASQLGLGMQGLQDARTSNIIQHLSNPIDMVQREYETRALNAPPGYQGPLYKDDPKLSALFDKLSNYTPSPIPTTPTLPAIPTMPQLPAFPTSVPVAGGTAAPPGTSPTLSSSSPSSPSSPYSPTGTPTSPLADLYKTTTPPSSQESSQPFSPYTIPISPDHTYDQPTNPTTPSRIPYFGTYTPPSPDVRQVSDPRQYQYYPIGNPLRQPTGGVVSPDPRLEVMASGGMATSNMFIAGDAPTKSGQGRANPELIMNPTNAPMMVIPLSKMVENMPRHALGTVDANIGDNTQTPSVSNTSTGSPSVPPSILSSQMYPNPGLQVTGATRPSTISYGADNPSYQLPVSHSQNPNNPTFTSYQDNAYQGLPSLQYLQGRIPYSTWAGLNNTPAQGAFGTRLPQAGALNMNRLLRLRYEDPDAYAALSSLYRSANRNLDVESSRAATRAPIGVAIPLSGIMT